MRFTDITEHMNYRKDWKEDYKRKLVSADEAAKAIKSRDLVAFLLPTLQR